MSSAPLFTGLGDSLQERGWYPAWRRIKSAVGLTLLIVLAAVAVVPLLSVLLYVIRQGAPFLTREFLTSLPQPVGETGGGMANALVGSVLLVAMASMASIPLGLGAGVYLSEYGVGRVARALRFTIDLLNSVPSIIVGLFAYALVVVPMKGFSAHAGAVALSVIMVPLIARSTEEVLALLPDHYREAGLALGLPRWKVILRIVLPCSLSALTTGIMLAVARVSGETAPLLFTAFGNRFWSSSLNQPIASLPVQIYNYAISPYDEWHGQAWAGALVLVTTVFVLNLAVRWGVEWKRNS